MKMFKNVKNIFMSLLVALIVVSSVVINAAEAVYDEPMTIVADKIICDDEASLPNWGEGGPSIDENTAQNFVDSNEGCDFSEGWHFQWAYGNVSNPGDHEGEAPPETGWNTFGPTDSNGRTSVDIYDTLGFNRIWVREVFEEGYIPFTYNLYGNNANDFSAELYCYEDVLNYDNYDFIRNPELGNTYYCIAFNVIEQYCGNNILEEGEECDDGNNEDGDGCSSECLLECVPEDEICDGVDNDCDGQIDEDFTNLGESCSVGIGKCETFGVYVCSQDGLSTECNAVPGEPSTEICDGLDNDCDASTDDGADELWLGNTCDGTDTDLCEEGTFSCVQGSQVCSDNTGDNLEICDGQDNDCNAATDDGADETWLNTACDGTDTDLCKEGTFSCTAGSQECSDNTGDNLELCDGADNDCDASTDDGDDELWLGNACDGLDTDLCEEGTFSCVQGSQTCSDDSGDDLEICDDELDNDCDGYADCNDNDCSQDDFCIPDCFDDSECGNDGYVGDEYCSGDDVYQDYIEYTCVDAGTQNAYCDDDQYPVLIETCSYQCVEGSCIPECTIDDDCDDQVFCNGQEKCIEGSCEDGTAPSCDDQNECTNDYCDTELNECVNNPLDYGSECGELRSCQENQCVDVYMYYYPESGHDYCDGEGTCIEYSCEAIEFECNSECDAECESDEDCECIGEDGCYDADDDGNYDDYVDYIEFGVCEEDCTCDIGEIEEQACSDISISIDDELCIIEYSCEEGDMRPCFKHLGVCSGLTETCIEGQWSGCDYDNLTEYGQEICDGLDNDCDGYVDEDESNNPLTQQCGQTSVGECSYGTQTCVEGSWGSCVGAVNPESEVCGNGKDDDCDRSIDEGCSSGGGGGSSSGGFFKDEDNDGYKANVDCDDKDETIYPGAKEKCDGADNDCDGVIDEDPDTLCEDKDCPSNGCGLLTCDAEEMTTFTSSVAKSRCVDGKCEADACKYTCEDSEECKPEEEPEEEEEVEEIADITGDPIQEPEKPKIWLSLIGLLVFIALILGLYFLFKK